ncbi:MAG: SLBB domain-containing protein [Elusimicrobiaceae bacterium]|nr:SLBB domain-containing protein [Elusimicrobiaceae bacterium]
MSGFSDTLRRTGVVGAGGAGFPAYVKAGARAEIVLMNAAECEPLLHKDIELLKTHTETVLAGFALLLKHSGAAKAVIGIKKKHRGTIALLEKAVAAHPAITVGQLGDFYPAGDEYCLVYELTGRRIPPGGIPPDVGVIVNNVETCLNMAQDGPVTHTFLTVTGAVRRPATFRAPIGARFADLIAAAGGTAIADPAYIDGGPMMGKVTLDPQTPVTKTTSGIIVLPKTHDLIIRKAADHPVYSRHAKSACDQCSYCTMLCPRNLLGYNVEPHKVMRSLLFSSAGSRSAASESGLLCCECSLCSLYSCPEGLDPRNMCVSAKAELRESGVTVKNSRAAACTGLGVHPMREYRKTPVSRLVKRLGLEQYKNEARLTGLPSPIGKVRILLNQHIGTPAVPEITVGAKVAEGQKIADVPADKLGVPLHASITGTVTAVTALYIDIES